MKVFFRCSLLLNGVLLGWLWFSRGEPHGVVPPAIPPTLPATPSPAAPVAAPAASVPVAPIAPAPFRWSQLDSSDYHQYVKNLRAIGCPEPSVRAIVTADVEAVYNQRAQRLEQKLTDLQGGSWSNRLSSANEEQVIQAALQQIPGQKAAMIADLLGLPRSEPPVPSVAVPVPLALQTFDLAALKLDPGQLEAMQTLRQRFLEQTGGTPPNPHDAAAMQRWQKAQAESDDQMEAFLGSEAYQNLQLQSLANSQAGRDGQR